jgi:ribosomal subunit interface protein
VKIIIKTKNIKLNKGLKDFVERKINDLERFSKIFQNEENYFGEFFGKGKPKVEAWVEIGKTTLHHRKGPFFRAECQMRLPRKSLRAQARAEHLREALTQVKDELQLQLKKYKNKFIAQSKRRRRELKKRLRLDPSAKFKKVKGARIREEGI